MDAEDLAPAALVGHADDDLAVEPAGPAQRLVDRLGAVGRGDHDEIGARLQPVHQRQQLRDEALLGLARHLAALGRDRIDLVDEDDRRRGLGRFLEHLAQPLFAISP